MSYLGVGLFFFGYWAAGAGRTAYSRRRIITLCSHTRPQTAPGIMRWHGHRGVAMFIERLKSVLFIHFPCTWTWHHELERCSRRIKTCLPHSPLIFHVDIICYKNRFKSKTQTQTAYVWFTSCIHGRGYRRPFAWMDGTHSLFQKGTCFKMDLILRKLSTQLY